MRYRFVLRGIPDGGVCELPAFHHIHLMRVGEEVLVPAGTVEWVEQDQLPVFVPADVFDQWRQAHPATVFTCPDCGATSYHPQDREHGYCGRCHTFPADLARTR